VKGKNSPLRSLGQAKGNYAVLKNFKNRLLKKLSETSSLVSSFCVSSQTELGKPKQQMGVDLFSAALAELIPGFHRLIYILRSRNSR